MKIRLAYPLQTDSIVDGEGIRTVIWTQGCIHNCSGCHNPNTHSFKDGNLVDINEINDSITNLNSQSGITFSGGDPMLQPEACLKIAKHAKNNNLTVWCYTGYTYENLLEMGNSINEFLEYIDVLVDGKFTIEEKSYDLKFRGSSNQRIIDVQKSINSNKIIFIERLMKKSIENKEKQLYI